MVKAVLFGNFFRSDRYTTSTVRRRRSVLLAVVLLEVLVVFSGCGQPTERPTATPSQTGATAVSPASTSVASTVTPLPATPTQAPEPDATAIPEAAPTPTMREAMDWLADDDPYHGSPEALVTIVEFSDYLCPFCGKFYLETLPDILATYGDEVRFVHRDYPMFGDMSYRASLAAGCANEQGKFWALHDVLFSIYDGFDFESIDHSQPPSEELIAATVERFNDDALTQYAQTAGLDVEAFQTCLAEEHPRDEIAWDAQIGQQLGIQALPTFYINGQVLSGFLPFDYFQDVIEMALVEADMQMAEP